MTEEYRDKGYAWVIAIATACANVIVVGILKSIGMIYIALPQAYGVSLDLAALISFTFIGTLNGMGLVSSFMVHKLGYRITLVSGSLLFSLGIFFSSFVSNGYQLLATFGVMQGIGIGFASTPLMAIASQYFLKHRAKANGIAIAGAALGSVVFPPIIELIIEEYGLRGAFLILSGISLNAFVASLLLRDPPKLKENRRQDKLDDKTEQKESMLEGKTSTKKASFKEVILSLLTSGWFYFILFAAVVPLFALPTFFTILPAHAVLAGIDKETAAFTISIISISDLFTRLTISYLVDKRFIALSTSYALSLLIAAIFITPLALVQNQSYAFIALFSVIYTTGYGSSFLHFPLIVSQYMAPDKLTMVYSFVKMLAVIPSFLIAPLTTYSLKKFGDYTAVFLLLSCSFAVSGMAWLIFSVVNYFRMKTQKNEIPTNSENLYPI